MTPTETEKLKHLAWAVESRARNQRCAVHLLRLFLEYEDQWKTKGWARAAQDLVSISFSLWRAAFLADKTGKRVEVFSHATSFLETIIEDNAISYPLDKKSKEWTFNYYTRSARASLEILNTYWPKQVPRYEGKKGISPTERWDYCQALLDRAVAAFEVTAGDIRAKKAAKKQAKQTRLDAKARKRKSREITLTRRK